MAITVRRVKPAVSIAQVQAHNILVATLVGSAVHATAMQNTPGSASEPQLPVAQLITQPNATDLPSAIVLLMACASYLVTHIQDAIPSDSAACGANRTLDTTNLAAVQALNIYSAQGTTNVTTLALAIAAANGLKAAANAHYGQAGVHFNNDGTSTIAAANASDLPTLITLVNACKTSLNAHTQLAPPANLMMVKLIP